MLLLADEEHTAEAVRAALRRGDLECELQRVATVEAYVDGLAADPDAILAQYSLMRFDALHALEVLEAGGRDVPLIVINGVTDEDVAVQHLIRGAADYLGPARLGRLGPALRLALERRALRREKRRAEQLLTIRSHQQAALNLLGQLALSETDPAAFIDEALHLVSETLDLEIGEGLLVLPGGKRFLRCAHIGLEDVAGTEVAVTEETPAGYTLLRKEAVVLPDLREDTRFRHELLPGPRRISSVMTVLVHGRSGSFGVLGMYGTQPHPFTVDDHHFLQAVANTVAGVLERKRAEEALQEAQQDEARVADSLARMGHELISALGRADLRTVVSSTTASLLAADRAQVWLWEPAEEAFVAAAGHGFPPDQWELIRAARLRRSQLGGLLDALDREAAAAFDFPGGDTAPGSAPVLPFAMRMEVESALVAALRRDGEVFGFLTVGWRRAESLLHRQKRVAAGIAQLVSMALEEARLMDELERQLRTQFAEQEAEIARWREFAKRVEEARRARQGAQQEKSGQVPPAAQDDRVDRQMPVASDEVLPDPAQATPVATPQRALPAPLFIFDEGEVGGELARRIAERGTPAIAVSGTAAAGEQMAARGAVAILNLGTSAAWAALRQIAGAPAVSILAYAQHPGSTRAVWFGKIGCLPADARDTDLVALLHGLTQRPRRVVVLGQDMEILNAVRRQLESARMSATILLDGRQALSLLPTVRPEAAIIHLSGNCLPLLRVLAGLRGAEAGRDLPFIFLLDPSAEPGSDAMLSAALRTFSSRGEVDTGGLVTKLLAMVPAQAAGAGESGSKERRVG